MRIPTSHPSLYLIAAHAAAFQAALGRAQQLTPGGLPTLDTFNRGLPPAARAAGAIEASRAQREVEKTQLPQALLDQTPSFNRQRQANNDRFMERIGKVEQEMAKVASDPKLSPADKAKKLDALDKQRTAIQKHIKPLLDPQQVTRELDAIAADPNLDNAQKQRAIEQLRDKWGLSKRGTVSMRTFTQHLAGVDHRHAKRVGEAKAEATKELERIKKEHGAKSVEYLQAKQATDMLEAERKEASERGHFLGQLYKPPSFWGKIGGAFKKVGGAFKKVGGGIWKGIKKVGSVVGKVAGFAMPLIKMIPGVGQIAGAAWGAVKGLGALVRGDWRGALGALAGAVPGLGSIPGLGGLVSKVTSVLGKIPGLGGLLAKVPGVGSALPGVPGVGSILPRLPGALPGAAGTFASVVGALPGAGGTFASLVGAIPSGGDLANVVQAQLTRAAMAAAAPITAQVPSPLSDAANQALSVALARARAGLPVR